MAAKDPAGQLAPAGGFKTGGWYSGYQYWDGSFAPSAGQIHPSSTQVGAGQDVSSEVMRQTSVAAGLEPGAHEAWVKSQRALQTPEDVTPYLNEYQQGLFEGLEAPEVKVPTMEELRGKLAPPGGPPELLDRVGMFEEMREEHGVEAMEKQLVDLKAQEREVYATLRQRRAAEEGKPVAMGVISGRVSEVEKQERENLDFVQRQKAYLIDELNTRYAVIDMYMKLTDLDYQDAVSRYDKQFTQNLQLFDIIRGYERDQLDQFEKARDNARANLQIYTNAVISGNMDYGSLGADQKLMIHKLEAQSGMPVGFVSSLGMSAKDRLITFNSKTGEALMTDGRGGFQVVQTGMRPSPTGDTVTERGATKKTAIFGEVQSELDRLGGPDKFVSPEEWQHYRRQWMSYGYSGSDFDTAFKVTYVGVPEERGWSSTKFGFEPEY